MWTSKNRIRYDRSKLRYPSDLTDEEWKLIEALIPPGKPGGDSECEDGERMGTGVHGGVRKRGRLVRGNDGSEEWNQELFLHVACLAYRRLCSRIRSD